MSNNNATYYITEQYLKPNSLHFFIPLNKQVIFLGVNKLNFLNIYLCTQISYSTLQKKSNITTIQVFHFRCS